MRSECVKVISTSEVVDPKFMAMEEFSFVQPFFNGVAIKRIMMEICWSSPAEK